MTPSAAERDRALRRRRTLGVRRILLLTGDNERVARALAAELWIDHRAESPPEEKIVVVRQLQAEGFVVAIARDANPGRGGRQAAPSHGHPVANRAGLGAAPRTRARPPRHQAAGRPG